MSPLAIWNHIPTVLDLNGPSLEFTTQPTGLTTTIGYAVTFSGIATVSYPAGTAIEGNIAYQWYNSTDGTPVTDGNRSNSRGGITTFSGAGTAQFDAQSDSADFNCSSIIIDSTPTGLISSVGLQIATSSMTAGQSGGLRFRSDSSSLSFSSEL